MHAHFPTRRSESDVWAVYQSVAAVTVIAIDIPVALNLLNW